MDVLDSFKASLAIFALATSILSFDTGATDNVLTATAVFGVDCEVRAVGTRGPTE